MTKSEECKLSKKDFVRLNITSKASNTTSRFEMPDDKSNYVFSAEQVELPGPPPKTRDTKNSKEVVPDNVEIVR